ncbi:hypothetical protein IZ6_12410 [Terrihabitans soli]|uniref:DUF2189 domain-containing protein n=1 Tax=Terrihabitans soli TaxID=708113 RepID=A0A6S6QMB2_9HYPH|nr:DUF2189 domain-containing protein [Terrihabitans soli]BCJ90506.1 hypothetical protein IZ6_12410 [Terrihabitans soli]
MTIRNPVEWAWHNFSLSGFNPRAYYRTQDELSDPVPQIRKIGISDLADAVAKGVRDFAESRTDVLFIGIIYPLAGLVLAQLVIGNDMLPLIFPLISGFALLGPVAAAGLYEMSRRREQGLEPNWTDSFQVMARPSFGALLVLAVITICGFFVWLATAWGIYSLTMGPESSASLTSFISDVFTTTRGWALIVVGCGVGFVFALAVLATSVFAFPLLLDRKVSLVTAVGTSVRAFRLNLVPMLIWGFFVALSLLIGAIPLLLGLIIVVPVLGHSTWHLYRKVLA